MIKPCPMCLGRPVNHVLARLINGPCSYCAGTGKVNTELTCKCGRPAVQLVETVRVCTRFECSKEVMENKTNIPA